MSGIDRNLGIARIDFDALARVLQLPAGQRITAAHCPISQEAIELRLEGDGLPLVRLGEVIPHISWPIKD